MKSIKNEDYNMGANYILLTEKETMWSKMLMEVLRDNNISCISQSVYGAGLTLKAGMQEYLRVYVPSEKLNEAEDLLQVLFSEGNPTESSR